jgi:cytochrome c oxidase subunit 4
MSNQSHEHHITPLSTYLKVYAALVVLTVVTVVVAHVNLGIFNTFVALLIATVKSGLVLAYFMHLKAEGKLNRVTIASALLFALIFYSLTASDIFTRKNFDEIAVKKVGNHYIEVGAADESKEHPAPTPGNPAEANPAINQDKK